MLNNGHHKPARQLYFARAQACRTTAAVTNSRTGFNAERKIFARVSTAILPIRKLVASSVFGFIGFCQSVNRQPRRFFIVKKSLTTQHWVGHPHNLQSLTLCYPELTD